MRIAFIETSSITNEVLRAYADAHPLCVGYPDGVPETWRTVSAAQQEGGAVPDLPMKHFTDETRGYPEGELDPAALLGPAAEPVDWPERDAAGDEEC